MWITIVPASHYFEQKMVFHGKLVTQSPTSYFPHHSLYFIYNRGNFNPYFPLHHIDYWKHLRCNEINICCFIKGKLELNWHLQMLHFYSAWQWRARLQVVHLGGAASLHAKAQLLLYHQCKCQCNEKTNSILVCFFLKSILTCVLPEKVSGTSTSPETALEVTDVACMNSGSGLGTCYFFLERSVSCWKLTLLLCVWLI